MEHFAKQFKRIVSAYYYAFGSAGMFFAAKIREMFGNDEAAMRMIICSAELGLKSMDILEAWNDDRRVIDIHTGMAIMWKQIELKSVLDLLREEQ